MGSWLEEAAASFSTRYTSRSRIVVLEGYIVMVLEGVS